MPAATSSRIQSPRDDTMHQRHECIAQASLCREKARADPARYDYWIDEAVAWHQRAIEASRGVVASRDTE